MKFSIITPVHDLSAPYTAEAFNSLLGQTHSDWEWIVMLNNGGALSDAIVNHAQVRVANAPSDVGNSIGALKKLAAGLATGEVIVEFDADDILTPDCLSELARAFSDEQVQMAYSNSAEFVDGTWQPHAYSAYYGWQTRPFNWHGHPLTEMVGWPASVHMMRHVYWCPNHVRAWRTSAYATVGGHNPNLKVADDHDLCCRFYLAYGAAGVRHIDRCLYLYRLHEGNSYKVYNAAVQDGSMRNYLTYTREMAIRWAKDQALDLLDLGGRFNPWTGFTTVDRLDADVVTDLNERWPFSDGSVGVLKAHHILEHLRDPIHSMNEAFRVLAPGGWLFIEVPSTDGRGAFQDPTHVSFWNQNSFWYYTNQNLARFIQPAFKGRYQLARSVTFFPTEFEKVNNIPYSQADLICLKPPYCDRPVGEILI